jgi:PIF1-like helicase
MSEDYVLKDPNLDQKQLECMVCFDLDKILQSYNSTIHDFLSNVNLLEPNVTHYYSNELYKKNLTNILQFNDEQQLAFNKISMAIQNKNNSQHKLFWINAKGGTGKTFLLNGIIANLVHNNIPFAATASSAKASKLLIDGETAHSTFNLPVEYFDQYSTCNIDVQSNKSKYLMSLEVIIIDEISMLHRYLLEAIDRTLRDIMDSDEQFGGKIVIVAGDLRQILPVVRYGRRAEIVSACFINSSLFKHITILPLLKNQRCQDVQFNEFIDRVGNGTEPCDEESKISIPSFINCVQNEKKLIETIYSEINEHHGDETYFSNRVILATTNKRVDSLNEKILDSFHSNEKIYYSIDKIDQYSSHGPNLSQEILNQLTPNGFPLHALKLKIGMPIIVLRNINKTRGK